MTFKLDPGQVSSGMRHVYTVLGTATALIGGLSLLPPQDIQTITTSVHQIGDGIVSIATGVAGMVPIASGLWAAWSASHKSRLTAIAADPQTTPAVKQAVSAVLSAPPGEKS